MFYSKEKLFSVNNIEIDKRSDLSNKELASIAIRQAFKELIDKILLDEDIKKLSKN